MVFIMQKLSRYIVDVLHMILLFFPILVYFIPISIVRDKLFKTVLIFIVLLFWCIPPHWVLFDNTCICTNVSNALSDNTRYISFSEEYLNWLYVPIADRLFTKNKMDKVVALHWTINHILMWYYVFYIAFNCV